MRRIIFACVFLGVAPLASANLLADGSFESPTLTPGGTATYSSGDTIGAWNVVGTAVSTVSTTYGEPSNGMPAFNAEDGLVSLDLTGPGNNGPTSGVSQSFASTAGSSYLLSFWVGTAFANNGSVYYQTPSTDDLSVNGGALVGYTNSNMTPGAVNWQQFQVNITATSASTNVTFTNGDSTNDEAGLDNVSVEATPEPKSFAILGLGLLGFLRRRK